ncbi:hypothetical protein F66182_9901 [Fusarium sp. NRRL 66182]|nr:hypothetical protein F66182_9901 [Fusarium sp. NRRL 66182]
MLVVLQIGRLSRCPVDNIKCTAKLLDILFQLPSSPGCALILSTNNLHLVFRKAGNANSEAQIQEMMIQGKQHIVNPPPANSGVNPEFSPKFQAQVHHHQLPPSIASKTFSAAAASSALRALQRNQHNVFFNYAPRAPCLGQVARSISKVASPISIDHGSVNPPTDSPTRTFTTLVPLRPCLTPMSGAIRRTALPSSFAPSAAASADIVPASAISAHPALGDMQIRCGPRNTMNGHTRLVQKRRHGFLVRTRSRTGRKILHRRKLKGRRNIAQ